ncbi:MAG: DNRLRE domain-containing protein, partial [Chloroflexota bacterium]
MVKFLQSIKVHLFFILIFLLIATLVLSYPVQGSGNVSITRTINVTEDATLYNTAASTRGYNYGGATTIQVLRDSEMHTVLRTTLSSVIPAGSTISSATLYLYFSAKSSKDPVGRTYYVNRLTDTSWVEGTGTGGTQAGSVTWNHQVHDTLAWSTVGGTYTVTNEGTGTVPASTGQYMPFTVTGLVQDAVTAGTTAEWVIRDPGASPNAFECTFDSSEGTNVPYISITYTAPWDSYESDYSTNRETFTSSYPTAYMNGTGFSDGTYNVSFYDAGASGGVKVKTDTNIPVSSGPLQTFIALESFPLSTAGTWHALAQPTGGTAFPPDYNTAVASPALYNLVANDSFE